MEQGHKGQGAMSADMGRKHYLMLGLNLLLADRYEALFENPDAPAPAISRSSAATTSAGARS